MFLFSKEKELVLKITNGVLLVWFLAAIVFSFNNGINLLVDKPSKEDNIAICKEECGEENKDDCKCESIYYYDNTDRYEKISFYTSLANVVVVGSALYFLNREKVKSKKK